MQVAPQRASLRGVAPELRLKIYEYYFFTRYRDDDKDQIDDKLLRPDFDLYEKVFCGKPSKNYDTRKHCLALLQVNR